MTITLQSVVAARPDQIGCDLHDEAVILDLKSGEYYGLDPVGARIWNLAQAPIRVSAILAELLEAYDVEPGRCQADLLHVLERLEAAGLIEVRSDVLDPT